MLHTTWMLCPWFLGHGFCCTQGSTPHLWFKSPKFFNKTRRVFSKHLRQITYSIRNRHVMFQARLGCFVVGFWVMGILVETRSSTRWYINFCNFFLFDNIYIWEITLTVCSKIEKYNVNIRYYVKGNKLLFYLG